MNNKIENLNKFERFMLDHIAPKSGRKWLLKN